MIPSFSVHRCHGEIHVPNFNLRTAGEFHIDPASEWPEEFLDVSKEINL